jgi:hypothetical protein
MTNQGQIGQTNHLDQVTNDPSNGVYVMSWAEIALAVTR